MTKVATYLRGHISGEVSVRADDLARVSTDGGILQILPELVVSPRSTNDIRKVARFSWQLAEKGHPLSITSRGGGTDLTGASIGKGIILDMTRFMYRIFEFDAKQQMVRLQPGTSVTSLQQALGLQGTTIRLLRDSASSGSAGGAVASAVVGSYANAHTIFESVDQLEVVLANGDVLQTEKISARELNKRKGLEGLIGDIYRGIDGIIDEYSEQIAKINPGDFTGYNSIAEVKRKDGSFDLTPLFIGSQGTLGIISEMILKVQPKITSRISAVLSFSSREQARDMLDELQKLHPQLLDFYEPELFSLAKKAGKTYGFLPADKELESPVVAISFEDDNERFIKKSAKKLRKLCAKDSSIELSFLDEDDGLNTLSAIKDVLEYASDPDSSNETAPSIYTGFHIPLTSLEVFLKELRELAEKEHVELPLVGHIATGLYGVYPALSLKKVGDKQKALKLIDKLADLVYSSGGILIAEGGEGILKSHVIRPKLDPKLVEMHDAIRKVFDPLSTLNPGVKQDIDLRTIAGHLKG